MDIFFSLLIRLIVWFSSFARHVSRLGLCQYEEWSPGKPVKILLVGYMVQGIPEPMPVWWPCYDIWIK